MGGRAIGWQAVISVCSPVRLHVAPAHEAVLSWNTFDAQGAIGLRLLRDERPAGDWFPYARWSPTDRRSFAAILDGYSVETDIVRADDPFDGVELRVESADLRWVTLATPVAHTASAPYRHAARVLDVPRKSQYVVPGQRGWCSPASLAMLHAYHGIDETVETVAERVYDRAYDGTGNWAFNVAYSGSLGLRATVAYLRNLDQAHRFIERSIPLAISYSWQQGELPGAPLERSDGHLAVLCGFTSTGDCVMNDPAAPTIATVYDRKAVETLWQRAGGVAYVIAPNGLPFADLLEAP